MTIAEAKRFAEITGSEFGMEEMIDRRYDLHTVCIYIRNIYQRKGSEDIFFWFETSAHTLETVTDEDNVYYFKSYSYNAANGAKNTSKDRMWNAFSHIQEVLDADERRKENQVTATMWRYDESMTDREFGRKVLEALTKVSQSDCGTISNPYEIASGWVSNSDHRTLIQAVMDGDDVCINDGYFAIDIRPSERFIYCDICMNLRDANIDIYRLETNCQDEDLCNEDCKDWARGMYEVKAKGEIAIYCKTEKQAKREKMHEELTNPGVWDGWEIAYIPTKEEEEKEEREEEERIVKTVDGDLFGVLAEIGVHFMESYQTDLLWCSAEIIHKLAKGDDAILFIAKSHADLMDRYLRSLGNETASVDECLSECQKTLGADYVITLHPGMKAIDIRILRDERPYEYKAENFKNSIFRGLEINIEK